MLLVLRTSPVSALDGPDYKAVEYAETIKADLLRTEEELEYYDYRTGQYIFNDEETIEPTVHLLKSMTMNQMSMESLKWIAGNQVFGRENKVSTAELIFSAILIKNTDLPLRNPRRLLNCAIILGLLSGIIGLYGCFLNLPAE